MKTFEDIEQLVDDRPNDGVFQVNAKNFSDQELFELEQKYVIERTWSFLGLDTQIPRADDFLTTHIGRTSVLVSRDGEGKLGAFLNMCRHKGALIANSDSGNRKFHVCSYHGWAYDSAGRNVNVKDEAEGDYPSSFGETDHGLIALPRFESYRGLLFGSLHADVPPLEEFLGEACRIIDLAMDQGPQGMEFVPGTVAFTYDANWKFQMDNGIDFYHLQSTHPSLMQVVEKRQKTKTGNVEAKQFDWKKRFDQRGGTFTFDHGHAAVWLHQGQPENRQIYSMIDEIKARVGEEKGEWMLKLRNMVIFPNLQIADSTTLIFRTFRPLAVNKTEMRVWCLAPIGEPDEIRTWRLRQFEDFFNVSGLATPDDLTLFETAQIGCAASNGGWMQGYQRGMTSFKAGGNDASAELRMKPVLSQEGSYQVQNEICFHATHREWARLMNAGMRGTPAYGEQGAGHE